MPAQNLLRTIVRTQPRSLARLNLQRRGFVSTVLLSKTYEDKTVAELKNEAKKRGLPTSGNKATLITRIQTDDNQSAHSTPAQPSAPAPPSHNASTSAAPTAESTPVDEAALQSKTLPVLDIHLPDLNQPVPEPPVQIPFVPDFWESSTLKAKSDQEAEPSTTPKLVTTADASTHHGGGPSLNLYEFPADSAEPHHSTSQAGSPSTSQLENSGIVSDVLDDLGLASLQLSPKRDAKLEREMKESLTYEATNPANREYSRKLDEDEKRGLWVLLGIFGGGWLLGGLFGN